MDEHTERGGVAEQPPRTSPWPIFVALGLALSEVGVVFNFLSVAVGGILLFAASVVGVLHESGYAETLWRPTAVVGALFAVAGAALVALTTFAFRGTYVGGAGGLLLAAAAVLNVRER